MPQNRKILTVADLFTVMDHIRHTTELFKATTDKKLRQEYRDKLNALGITIAVEEGLSVGAFHTLCKETTLKRKSKQEARAFLAWLRDKKLHP